MTDEILSYDFDLPAKVGGVTGSVLCDASGFIGMTLTAYATDLRFNPAVAMLDEPAVGQLIDALDRGIGSLERAAAVSTQGDYHRLLWSNADDSLSVSVSGSAGSAEVSVILTSSTHQPYFRFLSAKGAARWKSELSSALEKSARMSEALRQ